MAPKKDPEMENLKKELTGLAEKCREKQKAVCDDKACEGGSGLPGGKIIKKRDLKGHINKVTCCFISPADSKHAITGSLDGKLIIWDMHSGGKSQMIPLKSAWVMTAVISTTGELAACGGMDNQLTVYRLTENPAKIAKEFLGYEGFLSSCKFLSDEECVTGSGDTAIMHHSIATGKRIKDYKGHTGDVAALSLKPQDNKVFVTSSVDRTCRMWDLREDGCKQIWWGHELDINSINFHKNGNNFVTCSEDKTMRLWDIRADQEIAQYKAPTPNSTFTCCGISVSGRLIFASSDDASIHYWDLLGGAHQGQMTGHENRITQISVADNGNGIISSSWDTKVICWAR